MSGIMVYLNFQQNRKFSTDSSSEQSPFFSIAKPRVISYQNKSGVTEYNTVKQYKRSSRANPAYNTRMAFDYTMVSIEGSRVKSGSAVSGIRSYSAGYSKSVPESSRSTVSLPAYSGARSTVNPSANKVNNSNSMYAGTYKVQPFSRQSSNLQNVSTSSSVSDKSELFNSGLLASSGQTRQSANVATLEELTVDPGGDPDDPGEMIPVPDGLVFLLFAALLYLLFKVFVGNNPLQNRKSFLL